MACSQAQCRQMPTSETRKSLPSSQSHPSHGGVAFQLTPSKDDGDDFKKKCLTAKYSPEQMQLIKKRMAAEDWLWNQLIELYQTDDHDADVDMDELLDISDESDRIVFINKKIQDAPASETQKQRFIAELLEKVLTL